MENKKLSEIDVSQNYQGYLWWSNETKPRVYKDEKISEWPVGNNPFIIEGQLYNKDNRSSYSIRFVDGEYLVKNFNLNELAGLKNIDKKYLSNRIDGVSNLCFKEFWRPIKDELCEGMEVLQPAELIFVGFNK